MKLKLRVCFSSDVSASIEHLIKAPRTLEVLLLQCHYAKVFGVGRGCSFYCALMSTVLAAGEEQTSSLIHFFSSEGISANMSGDRMMHVLC